MKKIFIALFIASIISLNAMENVHNLLPFDEKKQNHQDNYQVIRHIDCVFGTIAYSKLTPNRGYIFVKKSGKDSYWGWADLTQNNENVTFSYLTVAQAKTAFARLQHEYTIQNINGSKYQT